MQKPDENSGFAKSVREVGPYLGLGLQLAVTIVAMVLLGSWLDKKFDSGYVFTLIGGIVGISAGIYNLVKTVNDLEKRSKNAQKK
jgi:F0F1-type ATP synthase assembly protein I